MDTEILNDLISSASATSVAELFSYSICTVKTNYQNAISLRGGSYAPPSIWSTISHIYRTRGIYGFYNSGIYAISSQVLSTTSKYTLYRTLTPLVPNKFLAGSISGMVASIFTHPFDVFKIHRQMNVPFGPEFQIQGLKIFLSRI